MFWDLPSLNRETPQLTLQPEDYAAFLSGFRACGPARNRFDDGQFDLSFLTEDWYSGLLARRQREAEADISYVLNLFRREDGASGWCCGITPRRSRGLPAGALQGWLYPGGHPEGLYPGERHLDGQPYLYHHRPGRGGKRGRMRGVKWIFFDVGSTLVDETAAYQRWAAEVLAGTDIAPAEFEAQRRRLAEAGDPGDGAVLAHFGLSDVPWHPEEEVPFPDAAAALSELRRRGYSLGIIANQVAGLAERLARRGMGGLFAVIVTSAEFGAKKPEAAMVGDRLDNDIAPAKRLGMRTVRILQGYGALSRPRNGWEEAEETVRTLAELPGLFPEDKGETE